MNQVYSTDRENVRQPLLVRLLAQLVSIVFHPLFIPTYITFFLLYLHPFTFAGQSEWYKKIKLASIFVSTAFFPAFTVFLLKQLGFAGSIHLRTQKDRIIPIVASMVFYFWIFYVAKNQGDNPAELISMLCACFVSSIIALSANNFIKISLHGIAMGILLTYFIYLTWISFIPMGLPTAIAAFITGIVGSSRLVLHEHTAQEWWLGFGTGAISMTIAALIFN